MPTIRVHISDVLAVAEHRAPGYTAEVLASGKVDGDNLEIEEGVFVQLREKYGGVSGYQSGCCGN